MNNSSFIFLIIHFLGGDCPPDPLHQSVLISIEPVVKPLVQDRTITDRNKRFWACIVTYHVDNIDDALLQRGVWEQAVGEHIQYITGQMEKAPTTGHIHWQLFVQFPKRVRLCEAKRIIGARAHIAPIPQRHRQYTDAIEYCNKDDTRFEGAGADIISSGVLLMPKGQGIRSDLEDICLRIKSMEPMHLIAADLCESWVKFHKGLQSLRFQISPHRTRRTTAVAIWGPTGHGKTSLVKSLFPNAYWFSPTGNNGALGWWDLYDGESVVVYDEYCAESKQRWSPAMFNLLCDSTPCTLDTKGARVKFNAVLFIYISNLNPLQWYSDVDTAIQQSIMRRLHVIEIDVTIATAGTVTDATIALHRERINAWVRDWSGMEVNQDGSTTITVINGIVPDYTNRGNDDTSDHGAGAGADLLVSTETIQPAGTPDDPAIESTGGTDIIDWDHLSSDDDQLPALIPAGIDAEATETRAPTGMDVVESLDSLVHSRYEESDGG